MFIKFFCISQFALANTEEHTQSLLDRIGVLQFLEGNKHAILNIISNLIIRNDFHCGI